MNAAIGCPKIGLVYRKVEFTFWSEICCPLSVCLREKPSVEREMRASFHKSRQKKMFHGVIFVIETNRQTSKVCQKKLFI